MDILYMPDMGIFGIRIPIWDLQVVSGPAVAAKNAPLPRAIPTARTGQVLRLMEELSVSSLQNGIMSPDTHSQSITARRRQDRDPVVDFSEGTAQGRDRVPLKYYRVETAI